MTRALTTLAAAALLLIPTIATLRPTTVPSTPGAWSGPAAPRRPVAAASLPKVASRQAMPAASATRPGASTLPGTSAARGPGAGPLTSRTGTCGADGAHGRRPPGAPSPYLCPVPGVVASVFDAPQTRYSAGHRGADLLATPGAAVRSPAAGVVAFAGMVAGRPVVAIDHGGGWRTSLEPVRSVLPAGTTAAAGDVVGVVTTEPGHCAPRTCVHLGLRLGDDYVDPLSVLGRRRVVLLPTGGAPSR